MGDAFGHIGELVRDPGDCFGLWRNLPIMRLKASPMAPISSFAPTATLRLRSSSSAMLFMVWRMALIRRRDHMADGHAHHHHADDQQQQLDRAADEDIAVDFLIQRLEVVADAHGAHDNVLGDRWQVRQLVPR